MNDTNPPKQNTRSDEASSGDDPLDLGLGDRGLAELFGDPADAAVSPQRDLDLDLSSPDDPISDNLFADLDFNAIDMAGLDEAAASPDDEFAATGGSAPTLTDHLTPHEPQALAAPEPSYLPVPEADAVAREVPSLYEPEPDPYGAVAEDDLLAAMDAIALDEPVQASVDAGFTAPPPLSVAPASVQAQKSSAAETMKFSAVDSPDKRFDTSFDTGEASAGDTVEAYEPSEIAESRSGAGKMIVMALAALAVVGVGGVFAFGLLTGSGEGDAPQVIAAPEGDDKVEPVANVDTAARPGDAAFSALDQNNETVSSSPRVVLPSPSGNGLALRAGEPLPSADIAPAPPGSTASRAVRTVTVRADGTVVESTAPAPVTADVQTEAADARPVEIVSVTPQGVSPNPQLGQDAADALRAAVQDAAQNAAQAASQTLSSSVAPPQPVARPAAIAAAPVQTQPVQIQAVQTQPVQSQTVQSANRVQPIQLATPAAAPVVDPVATSAPAPAAPLAPAAAVTPASVPTGEFIVQLASLRSEAEARSTFTNLQNRFGSILAGYGPNIQRADLGDRGVFHRVRVGPMDRNAADSLCSRYQSAGGDCFVQRQ
jgi:cell division septation protein DedD